MVNNLRRLPGFKLEAVSPFWLNPAKGADVQGQFLNGVAVGITYVGPLELLRRLKWLERCLGRRSEHRNRPADLDILCWQDDIGWRSLQLPHLVIPHPRARQRDFVLLPLSQMPLPPPAPLLRALRRWQHHVSAQLKTKYSGYA